MMLCDRCGQREATHHDLVVNGGEVRETHLCESCAQGLTSGAAQPPATLGEWLTNFVLTPPEAGAAARATAGPAKCETCGLTFSQLKKTGLVGCEDCYTTFESRLTPLLQRAHDGGARHIGKKPKRLGESRAAGARPGDAAATGGHEESARTLAERVKTLRAELAEAVELEAYEKAAAIRDQLQKLLGSAGNGGSGGGEDA